VKKIEWKLALWLKTNSVSRSMNQPHDKPASGQRMKMVHRLVGALGYL
jgi:hypothetical protein